MKTPAKQKSALRDRRAYIGLALLSTCILVGYQIHQLRLATLNDYITADKALQMSNSAKNKRYEETKKKVFDEIESSAKVGWTDAFIEDVYLDLYPELGTLLAKLGFKYENYENFNYKMVLHVYWGNSGSLAKIPTIDAGKVSK